MYFFHSYFEIKIKMLNQHFNIVTIVTFITYLIFNENYIFNLSDTKIYVELQVDQAPTPLSQKDDPTRQRVHVAVYYEALCPDSRSFILKQLGPTYRRLTANVEVELVPYGKATVS